jgi:co-chaperonin GroES (HSP10)|tara:strand:+ start:41 stop:298 length:258 start_codon:yes stop_codon:yes gene_type:complete
MKPIGKNIIIKTLEEELITSSGLMLSAEDANQMRYKKGIVIKSGTDVAVIKENDLIYFDKRAGYTLIIKDEPMTIIQEKDVVVVL